MNSTSLLKEDGTPDVARLIDIFNRCAPTMPGGLEELDNIRFNRWPNQSTDGRKHDVTGDPNGAAKPWNGASDVRPFTVDNIINENVGTLTEAFWRSMAQPGSASSDEGAFAVALSDYLIWNVLYDSLVKEVELSAQYVKHYGWCVLAPRWCREVSLKRLTITLQQIQQEAQAAAPEDPVKQLPLLILDPTLEDQAVEWLTTWYQRYLAAKLPADVRARAPKLKAKTVRRCVKDLRSTGTATAPMPYVCRDEPEVCALKPWDEVFLPIEGTDTKDLVFQREFVSVAELLGRQMAEDYEEAWVTEAKKNVAKVSTASLPTGVSGQALRTMGGNTVTQQPAQTPGSDVTGMVEVIHAVYLATDEDDVPGIYMTTFHRMVSKDREGNVLYAKHGLAETERARLPYVAAVNEWISRSVAASRSVPEMAHTDQNLVKGTLDALVDRTSISIVPPVNVYTSPLEGEYKFGPATRNYVKAGREPQFMQMPSGQGMVDGVEVYELVSKRIDNRFALLSPDVPPVRVQTAQGTAVRRFLLSWTAALQHMLWLCQRNMKDQDFADITGAPAGWLDQHRDDENLLQCGLQFDVRELDSELTMKRVEAVNKIVLPADVMGTVNRAKWARVMLRCISPAWAKEVMMPADDASQALYDKASDVVLKMFAGNPPKPLDKEDPTAGSLLKYTQQILASNPVYQKALTDEALVAVAGPNAAIAAQQIGPRNPNQVFSDLLIKWLEHLKFLGETQPRNKEIGRIGVDLQGQQ